MSNIHRLSDYQNRGDIINSSQGQSGLNLRFIDLFFPGITWKHTIVWISIIQTIIYIATCIVGSWALSPSVPTLIKFQASVPKLIKQGQIWRLLISLFLHASIWHIIFNIFFQLKLAISCEDKYGRILCPSIYFITGIIGNLFSAAIRNSCIVAVGASTSGFGLIGTQLAELILFWHIIQNKERVILNILLFGILMVLITWGNPTSAVDHWGHTGGFLTGLTMGVFVNYNSESKPKWYRIALGIAVSLIIGLLVGPIVRIWAFKMASCYFVFAV
ncbi:rhomboid family protein [Cryptosporidium andersoni]|uniref:Rhomboid-like protease n=1 Tax=Cryptosporidium andersoni TaxID=117008 RepID=A0A1J4MUE5_9CRYT|nr:rhomboid family protein [Cryptosporidium andersoni]